ncbi:hypothetical protein EVAR_102805_1 [Eumeta japonica]|uniref:Uncharacterized protein n=1 Tax=Eumeta variegata TaxID=151549 RepID=A0A4C1TL77_EUMVA|nr:hypothetical protein EVAR_102805_1 [Eumeta japonica]
MRHRDPKWIQFVSRPPTGSVVDVGAASHVTRKSSVARGSLNETERIGLRERFQRRTRDDEHSDHVLVEMRSWSFIHANRYAVIYMRTYILPPMTPPNTSAKNPASSPHMQFKRKLVRAGSDRNRELDAIGTESGNRMSRTRTESGIWFNKKPVVAGPSQLSYNRRDGRRAQRVLCPFRPPARHVNAAHGVNPVRDVADSRLPPGAAADRAPENLETDNNAGN